jgi:iron complex outermembrane recepter protein
VLAGARYDHAVTHNLGMTMFPPFGTISGDGFEHTSDNSQRVTPRYGLLWRPVPELSVYGNYTENFGAATVANPDGSILPPETAQGWEVGAKTEFFDKRLTASVDYFYLMRQHVAAADPDPVRAVLGYKKAMGEQRNKGIEFDLAGEILPRLKVIASYAWIDAIISKDNGTVYDYAGSYVISNSGFQGFEVPGVSRHMGSLWATYEFRDEVLSGLKVGGGANFRGKSYADYYNSFHVPSYATLGLMTSYSWMLNGNKLTAQLNVDNLLDTRYYSDGSFANATTVEAGQPRTFKGSVRMEF